MYPARGLAIGDLNNDGYPDVIVANSGEQPVILQHTGATANHWLGLAGIRPGWKITWSVDGRKLSRLKTAGGSYLSAHDPRELLGLGNATLADSVEIIKPDSSVLRFKQVKAGRYYTLTKDGNLR
jgi:hypothetical protein